MYGPENYSEGAKKMVELKDCYLIPILSWATSDNYNKFYILKLDKNAKIISRTFYNDRYNDEGALFNANDNNFWKISVNGDVLNHYYFRFHLLDSDLNELLNIKIPSTHPQNGLLGLEEFYYLKLTNGDFIFMLDVSANNWNPFTGEVYGNNFIYITKEGEVKTNKTFNAFNLYNRNYIWQLNDTSIISIVPLTKCTGNCSSIKIFDFKGNEILSKTVTKGGFSKKCGNRYYGFWEWKHANYSLVCFNENFDLLYEKKIPEHVYPIQFWDNQDNNDFRVRVINSNGFNYYETMMDTSFTWEKLKLFSNDSDNPFAGLQMSEPVFYPTNDGGAFYVFDKTVKEFDDIDLVFVKVDTTKWINDAYDEKTGSLIYPNPNNGNFLVIKKEGWQTAAIYDVTGRKLFEFENPSFNGTDAIDIKYLRPGNYYLQIKFPDKTVYNKFIRY